MERLTMVPPAPGEDPVPGWPNESWDEYATASVEGIDVHPQPATVGEIHDALRWLDGEVAARAKYIREHTGRAR